MNTHNVNVKTAASESTETRVKTPVRLWPGCPDDLMPFVVTVSGRSEEQGEDGWHTATLTLGHARTIAEALETAAAAWLRNDWDPRNEYLVTDMGPIFFEPETLTILDDSGRTVLTGDADSLVWHMPQTETDDEMNCAWLGHPDVAAAVRAFVRPERKRGGITETTGKQPVTPALRDTPAPVAMQVIQEIAAMAERTERPALIWGNTDRATTAAEAVWIFARRTGLDGRGDEAFTAVQDLIANLMHLCEQEGITGGEVTFASLVSQAETHYLAERDE
ncbi:hypothetical protein F3J38_26390 [Pantoea sp. Acro-805]|uniref:Uncharacterized protein n=1 Tax=Candidatus Pantoea formicae TaxID=2608355 RepID=A0ABX0R5W5_9GAMM|nr:hypothetical protein [Pantoea formicae]NIF03535.1 hypothetical protein [Pantoea formicae]